jgi:hypothetical protein
MSKIAIITAIYDNYDVLKPIVDQSVDVEWICVTDGPDIKPLSNLGWKIIYEPRPHLHPNRAAKTPKCLPWLYTDAAASIWIDASYQVKSPTFAEEAISYADPIAQFVHPWRDCIYTEANESIKLPKYKNEIQSLIDQTILYAKADQHPINWGLWATGVIARLHTPDVIQFGFDWLADIHNFSFQDQISHPPNMRRNSLRPTKFPGTHLSNDWLDYQGSGRH